MSFFSDPIGNISGAIHTVGKDISNATKNPLVDMAAAAALDYFTGGVGGLTGAGGLMDTYTGLGAAGNAALLTGGIAGLSSGNLAQGLMAGMAGYGGASLGEGMGMGNYSAATPAETPVQATAPVNGPTPTQPVNAPANVASDLSPNTNPAQGLKPSFAPTTADSPYSMASKTVTQMPGSSSLSALDSAPKQSPFSQLTSWFGRQDPLTQLALGAGTVYGLKSLATPQKLNAPNAPDTRFVKYYSYNPMGGYGYQGQTPAVQAASAATGGLVALANGGAIKHYDGSAGSAVTSDPGVGPTQAQLDAVDAAYQAGNYQQAQNLVDQYGVTSADVSRYAPTFDQSVLAKQGIGLAGQDVLSAPVAANAVQSFANPDVAGTNLTQAEINQLQSAYGAKDYAAANTMANQYGLTQADLTALYGNTAPSASTLASQGITLPGATNAANADVAATNLSLPVINQMYDAWQTGDYKTAQALATQSGLTSQDLSNLFPNFNQNELALAGIQLGLQPTKPTVVTPGGTANTGTNGPATTTQTVLPTNPQTNAPAGTTNPYGNVNNPGDITLNPDGSKTITPNVPGRPYGGFSGMNEVTNAYTAGGGSTGYTIPTYKNMDEFNAANNTLTGGSKAAYDYLMGKTPWQEMVTPTGQISAPYQSAVLGQTLSPQYQVSAPQVYDPATHTYKGNPNYDPNFSATRDYLGSPQVGISSNTAKILGYTPLPNGVYGYANGDGTYTGIDGKKYDSTGKDLTSTPVQSSAAGGLQGLATGGMSVGHLGGYSDGGRLLRGPGDGVSDSIPATIGASDPEPARLADGEFVVPARIVSELGNGSTEAGARQLYKMMDRIQTARRKTTGKDAVATNTNASKYLPA